MSSETIALLIKWGPLVVVGVVFLWCFVAGLIRGTYKVTRRLIYVVLFVLASWLCVDLLSRFILDLNITIDGVKGVRNYIVHLVESNESISEFLGYSPALKEIIVERPEILINPILFIVLVLVVLPLSFPIYWIYLIIFNLIAKFVFHREKYMKNEEGEILRNEKGKKVKVKRKKRRLLGGLVRGVQGVVLFCVSLLPINFVNRIYNEAKDNADLDEGETLCSSFGLEGDSDVCKYLDIYNETIFGKTSGEKSFDKYIMDKLTTAETESIKINLEDELSNVAVIAVLLNDSGLLDILLEGKIDLDTLDLSVVKFEKLNLVVDRLFSSSLISEVVRAGSEYLMNEVAKDNLVELLKDDNIIDKINYETSSQIKDDIKSVLGVLELAVEKGVIDSIIDNRENVVGLVKDIDAEAVEELLIKILNVRIVNSAMPSVLKAYVSEYGVDEVDQMTEEFNEEVSSLLGDAIRFVKTMEVTKLEDLTEGNLVDNLANALFENGALKDDSKDALATLLHKINSSYLFSEVIPTQVNKLLEDKDYKVDARVIKYVDSKEAWIKELDVLDVGYKLYNDYTDSNIVNYDNVTGLLNKTKDTKIIISLLPLAYDEFLPKVGIEIDSEGLPVIDFDTENEEDSKKNFYDTWEAELVILKNVADYLEVLQLQSTEEITIDLLKDEENVEAMSGAISEVYKSTLLKEPFVEFFVDFVNDFVKDYEVEFTKEELLVIDNKQEWANELNNINEILEVDLSDIDNVTSENLSVVFESVGDMQLFNKKKIDILKYAVRESEILSTQEYSEVEWPVEGDSQEKIDGFWDKETGILLNIIDEKDILEELSDFKLETMDTDKIGGLLDVVIDSNIWQNMVVSKMVDLFNGTGVSDDRDEGKETRYLKENIKGVDSWSAELKVVQELLNITGDNYDEVETGQVKTRLEVALDKLDREEGLFYTMRGALLIKAVTTINITDVPSEVTKKSLAENAYEDYLHEKSILIEVSNNRETFDKIAETDLKEIDADGVGALLDTVSDSLIFGDYVADQIVSMFVDVAKVSDDRDEGEETSYLKENVKNVDNWSTELKVVKELLNITGENYDKVEAGQVKTRLEVALDKLDREEGLFYTMRGSLLIKAVTTIDITDVPSEVTKKSLAENAYEDYLHEKSILIEVSNNRETFDKLGDTKLKDVDTDAIGDLLNSVSSSLIFGDYIADEMVSVFENAKVYDDRDAVEETKNLKRSIVEVDDWKKELAIVKSVLNIDGTNYTEKDEFGKTKLEKILNDMDEGLFKYKRATLLIKALNTINVKGLNSVSVEELRGEEDVNTKDYPYTQYLIEKNVFVSFAKADVNNLMDITKVSEADADNLALALDNMKSSKIFGDKYVEVLSSSLGEISKNQQLNDYGVHFKGKAETNNYKDIVWSAQYDEGGNLVKRNEVYNLIIIGKNIEEMSKFDKDSLLENKVYVIGIIGETLDAIESSVFLGEDAANNIANQVIVQITDIPALTVNKGSYNSWSSAFDAVLSFITL